MPARWVIAGGGGQLGRALVERLGSDPERDVLAAPGHAALDIADAGAVRKFFGDLPERPDVVVNAAAFTHVDRCEREPEVARRVNGVAPGLLAQASRAAGAFFVHVSTDYVFPGDASRPYREDDPTGPHSVYGRTKLEGERRVRDAAPDHLLARTSWVFGAGRNFVGAIVGQARARQRGEASGPLRVVDDQVGRPTYAADLAGALLGLVECGARGLYHVANDGVASWWDLARSTLDEAGFAELEIERITTADLDLPAPRPAWSVLDCSKAAALGVRVRSWREALRAYLESPASPLRDGGH